MIKIKDALKGVAYGTKDSLAGVVIHRATDDSRNVGNGDLFVAVKGHDLDGHKFIDAAIAKGARAVAAGKVFKAPASVKKILLREPRKALASIAANTYGHPYEKMKMIGITGTNGKTTTAYLIEHVLQLSKRSVGVIGTINYRFKGKTVAAKNTTPGPFELQELLAQMRRSRVGYCVMEVSSHSLDQNRVDPIQFDAAVFTNITSDHLDYHKTPVNYFKAKAKLFDKVKRGGIAILNRDDTKVAALQRSIKRKALTYGLNRNADIRAESVRLALHGSTFRLVTPRGAVDVGTSLIGKHNISNILAAAAVCIAQKLPLKSIKAGIESFGDVPGRMEAVDAGQSFKVFVDFAHTEDALYNILTMLREVASGHRIITVFGCGGNRDRKKRPLMGRVACRFSDDVIITSDNPRFEEPAAIIREIEDGLRRDFSNYRIVEDRREAIGDALKRATENSIVVIAGKGHEKYQIIRDSVMPFDDCSMAREILLGSRNKGPGLREI